MSLKEANSKPIVRIDLRPHLIDFLVMEFGTDPETGAILLNRKKDTGLFIDGMWSVSDVPVRQEFEHPCDILLPTSQESHYVAKYNFLYFSKWKCMQVNEYLDAVWRRYVRDFFSIGYQKGYKQMDIVNALLDTLNIRKNAVSYDMVKKLDYRNRKNYIKNVSSVIQSSMNQ